MICRDQNSPELARAIAGMGARGIFILSAHYYDLVESRMKREKNRALPIARAYENGVYVFKANAVGSIQGKVSYGGSMLIDPRGITIQSAGERDEELLVCDIDFGRENPRW
jgi:predicted amidohydrolase